VSKLRNFNHVFDVDRNPFVSSTKLQETDILDLSQWDVSQGIDLKHPLIHAPGMCRKRKHSRICFGIRIYFGRLDAPEQEQRRGQDFTITTITSTTDDDDKDDFELSDDDFVLLKNDIIQHFNLCGWRWKLPSSADTRKMFE